MSISNNHVHKVINQVTCKTSLNPVGLKARYNLCQLSKGIKSKNPFGGNLFRKVAYKNCVMLDSDLKNSGQSLKKQSLNTFLSNERENFATIQNTMKVLLLQQSEPKTDEKKLFKKKIKRKDNLPECIRNNSKQCKDVVMSNNSNYHSISNSNSFLSSLLIPTHQDMPRSSTVTKFGMSKLKSLLYSSPEFEEKYQRVKQYGRRGVCKQRQTMALSLGESQLVKNMNDENRNEDQPRIEEYSINKRNNEVTKNYIIKPKNSHAIKPSSLKSAKKKFQSDIHPSFIIHSRGSSLRLSNLIDKKTADTDDMSNWDTILHEQRSFCVNHHNNLPSSRSRTNHEMKMEIKPHRSLSKRHNRVVSCPIDMSFNYRNKILSVGLLGNLAKLENVSENIYNVFKSAYEGIYNQAYMKTTAKCEIKKVII